MNPRGGLAWRAANVLDDSGGFTVRCKLSINTQIGLLPPDKHASDSLSTWPKIQQTVY